MLESQGEIERDQDLQLVPIPNFMQAHERVTEGFGTTVSSWYPSVLLTRYWLRMSKMSGNIVGLSGSAPF